MSKSAAKILFFASLKDVTHCDEVTLDLAEPVRLPALLEMLARELPDDAMAGLRAENVRVAVNQTFMTGVELIQPGDEVAFMPPVTGG